MGSDPIGDYQGALQRLEEAQRHAERYVQTISEAARALNDWRNTSVSNVEGIGFSVEVSRSPHTINASNWPTAEQLARALTTWHGVMGDVSDTWRRIPAERRTGLNPPPS